MAKSSALERRGMMFVLSAPSGGGKTTIKKRLLEMDANTTTSVSATTRARRPGEIEGKDYYFVTPEKFDSMIKNNELMEHATVHGNRYGIPRVMVEDALSRGKDVIFDIDWQGARKLTEVAKVDIVSIFLLPPSRAALEDRLRTRGQDSEEVILQRIANAAAEMPHYAEYNHVIINQDIDETTRAVYSILIAERTRRERIMGLQDFVNALVGG